MSRCRECGRSSDQTWTLGRFGGGNYRRAGRWYYRQVCDACIRSMVDQTANLRGQDSWNRYSVTSIRLVAARAGITANA